jgi:RHS repeat-associated protein
MSEIALPDGTTAQYGYDTENLRVSMDDVDGARRILLDGLEEWGEVDEASGELAARFDHDPTLIDALLAQHDGGGHVAMLTDALGSVYALADDATIIRERYGYDAHGEVLANRISTRWGFIGRTVHTNLGLIYARSRYASLEGTTWLSADPGGFIDGTNRYRIVRNRPTFLRDPTGLAGLLLPSLNCEYLTQIWLAVGRVRTEAALAEADTAAGLVTIAYRVIDDISGTIGEHYERVPPLLFESGSFECDCSLHRCGEFGSPFNELDLFRINEEYTQTRLCGQNSPLASTLLHEWAHYAVETSGVEDKHEEVDWEDDTPMLKSELIAQTLVERAFGNSITGHHGQFDQCARRFSPSVSSEPVRVTEVRR